MASLAVIARGSPCMPADVTAMLVHRPPSTLSSAVSLAAAENYYIACRAAIRQQEIRLLQTEPWA